MIAFIGAHFLGILTGLTVLYCLGWAGLAIVTVATEHDEAFGERY
jgi:biotin transporter BioY